MQKFGTVVAGLARVLFISTPIYPEKYEGLRDNKRSRYENTEKFQGDYGKLHGEVNKSKITTPRDR